VVGVFSEWLSRAACKGETDWFFSYDEEFVEHARAICEDCEVREECLQTALADPNLYGVWGGTTKAERRRIHRKRVA
jgi:WhiB family redox-sensing transcriptional regulator